MVAGGEEVQENVLLETQEGEDAHLHPYKSVEDYKKDMKLRGKKQRKLVFHSRTSAGSCDVLVLAEARVWFVVNTLVCEGGKGKMSGDEGRCDIHSVILKPRSSRPYHISRGPAQQISNPLPLNPLPPTRRAALRAGAGRPWQGFP